MNAHQQQARLFKALAHPIRLRILARQEACACHLTAAAPKRPHPSVSQQLSMLRDASLVAGRREGTLIYCRLRDARIAGLLAAGHGLVPGSAPMCRSAPCPAAPVPVARRCNPGPSRPGVAWAGHVNFTLGGL